MMSQTVKNASLLCQGIITAAKTFVEDATDGEIRKGRY